MVIALLVLLLPDGTIAATNDDPAFCSVYIAAVKPIGAAGTRQAFAIQPMVDGTATLSGSIAVYTADDRRYDLPFANVTMSNVSPGVLVYQFAQPVRITGAYVATLDQPTTGPCAISEPWTDRRPAPPPTSHPAEALAAVDDATRATRVADPGHEDRPACPVPTEPGRTVAAARPEAIPGIVGRVYVLVTIGTDGVPIDAGIERMDATIAQLPRASVVGADAVQTAMRSRFVTATFRCTHVIDRDIFIVDYLAR
jgi:hypothetical protein